MAVPHDLRAAVAVALALSLTAGCGPGGTVGDGSGSPDAGPGIGTDGVSGGPSGTLDASPDDPDSSTGFDINWGALGDLGPPPEYESCDEPPPAEWTWANPVCLHGPAAEVPATGPLTLSLETQIPTNLAGHSTPIVSYLEDDDDDGVVGPGDVPRVLAVLTHQVTADGAELRVFNGETGSLQWVEGQIAAAATPAVGDLDGDGEPEVVVPAMGGTLLVLRNDGSLWWSAELPYLPYPWYRPHPAISDMDGDGCPEVVMGTAIYDCTGNLRWSGDTPAQAVIADLDLDGVQEAVYGHLIVDPDGNVEWAWSDPLTSPQAPNSVAVANFDDDPEAEFLVSPLRKVRLHDTDGSLLWYVDLGEADPRESGAPVIADFDRDGWIEAGIAYRDVFLMLNHDGSILWSHPISDPSTGALGAGHDFDDDGYVDVMYADHARLQVFAGPDGTIRHVDEDHVSNTFWEYPLVSDVDGDGDAELVAADMTGIRIFGSGGDPWRPARAMWNQHAFAQTHILEDGSVPAQPLPHFLLWNTFRVSAPEAVPIITDVRPELITVCEQDCGGGLMRVRVRLHNAGTTDLPADVRVALYGPTGALLSVRSADVAIPALHTSETLELLFKRADAGDGPLLLSADDDGKGNGLVDECDEGNNQIVVQGPFCAPE